MTSIRDCSRNFGTYDLAPDLSAKHKIFFKGPSTQICATVACYKVSRCDFVAGTGVDKTFHQFLNIYYEFLVPSRQ